MRASVESHAHHILLYVQSHDHNRAHRVAVKSQRVAESAVKNP